VNTLGSLLLDTPPASSMLPQFCVHVVNDPTPPRTPPPHPHPPQRRLTHNRFERHMVMNKHNPQRISSTPHWSSPSKSCVSCPDKFYIAQQNPGFELYDKLQWSAVPRHQFGIAINNVLKQESEAWLPCTKEFLYRLLLYIKRGLFADPTSETCYFSVRK
jgi:hypothetical protein